MARIKYVLHGNVNTDQIELYLSKQMHLTFQTVIYKILKILIYLLE